MQHPRIGLHYKAFLNFSLTWMGRDHRDTKLVVPLNPITCLSCFEMISLAQDPLSLTWLLYNNNNKLSRLDRHNIEMHTAKQLHQGTPHTTYWFAYFVLQLIGGLWQCYCNADFTTAFCSLLDQMFQLVLVLHSPYQNMFSVFRSAMGILQVRRQKNKHKHKKNVKGIFYYRAAPLLWRTCLCLAYIQWHKQKIEKSLYITVSSQMFIWGAFGPDLWWRNTRIRRFKDGWPMTVDETIKNLKDQQTTPRY